MKAWVRYSAASVTFVVGVGGSVLFNQVIEPNMNSTWVYVAANTPEMTTTDSVRIVPQLVPGQSVPGQNANLVKMPTNLVSPNAITNRTELASLYTSQILSPNEQLTTTNTEADPYTLTANTQDVPVSPQWVMSVSGTLRQGDYVDLIPIQTQQNQATSTKSFQMTAFHHVFVLSVHTSQNTEVQNYVAPGTAPGPQGIGARQNATGTPSEIDLKMTAQQALLFANDVQNKDQFLIYGVAAPISK